MNTWGSSWGLLSSWGGSWGLSVTTPDSSTPGRIERSYEEWLKRQGRTEERPVEAPLAPDARIAEYVGKSRQLAAALERTRRERAEREAEIATLRGQVALAQERNRKAAQAKAEKALLLQEQAVILAKAQEAMLLEQLEVVDIAYVSVIALAMLMN